MSSVNERSLCFYSLPSVHSPLNNQDNSKLAYNLPSLMGFPDGSADKESACNAGDIRDSGSIPVWGRSPGRRNGNPLQYFTLRIPWTEEPGGLRSMGSPRVGHDWSNLTILLYFVSQWQRHHGSVCLLRRSGSSASTEGKRKMANVSEYIKYRLRNDGNIL